VKYSSLHLKVFNLLGRIVGGGFVVVGLILLMYAISSHDWIAVSATAIVIVLGVLLLMAKPYKPN
jgi:hypothetical protein